MISARSPPTISTGSRCTRQVTECGSNRPVSGSGVVEVMAGHLPALQHPRSARAPRGEQAGGSAGVAEEGPGRRGEVCRVGEPASLPIAAGHGLRPTSGTPQGQGRAGLLGPAPCLQGPVAGDPAVGALDSTAQPVRSGFSFFAKSTRLTPWARYSSSNVPRPCRCGLRAGRVAPRWRTPPRAGRARHRGRSPGRCTCARR
jgi:hypothetical protein